MGSGIILGIRGGVVIGVLLLRLAALSPAMAQPANDDYANRITITGTSNLVSGTLRGSSIEGPDVERDTEFPSPAGSVWWSWTAPSDGHLTLHLVDCSTNGSPGVRASIRPAGKPPTRNLSFVWPADTLFLSSRVEAGVTYDIVVLGSAEIDFRLRVIAHPGPIIMRDLSARRAIDPGSAEVLSVLVGFNSTNPPAGDINAAMPWKVQWMRNGQELPGRTNLCLIITNASPADAGVYTVAVWDAFGTNVSSPCQLDVDALAAGETGRLSVVRPGSGGLALSLESFRRTARLVSSDNLVEWSGENAIRGLIGTGSVFQASSDGSPLLVPLASNASAKFIRVQRYVPANETCNALLRALRASQIQWQRQWNRSSSAAVTLSDLMPYLGTFPNVFPNFRCPAGGIVMVQTTGTNPFCYGGHDGGTLEVPD